jgi:PHS family inorganic phosphate transporter-like MFS transporter
MPSTLRPHFGFIAVTGAVLFGDGYLNISIGLIAPMLGYIYFQDEESKVLTVSSDAIKGSRRYLEPARASFFCEPADIF